MVPKNLKNTFQKTWEEVCLDVNAKHTDSLIPCFPNDIDCCVNEACRPSLAEALAPCATLFGVRGKDSWCTMQRQRQRQQQQQQQGTKNHCGPVLLLCFYPILQTKTVAPSVVLTPPLQQPFYKQRLWPRGCCDGGGGSQQQREKTKKNKNIQVQGQDVKSGCKPHKTRQILVGYTGLQSLSLPTTTTTTQPTTNNQQPTTMNNVINMNMNMKLMLDIQIP